MNRDDYRKALDAEREVFTKRNPLPPWARTAVTHATVVAFVLFVAALGMIAFGFAYMALQILWWIIQ
jgi:hypothetical protein